MSKTQGHRFVSLQPWTHVSVLLASLFALLGIATSGARTLRSFPSPTSSCPKVLFLDGFSPSKSNNENEAKYWGETVGIDGLFLGGIMYTWEDGVGDDENGRAYQE